MLVYVDDIIITGNNNAVTTDIVTKLRNTFPIKDLGRLNYFLGIEIVPTGNDVILSQRNYILDLIQKMGLSDSKLTSSLMAPTSPLSLADSLPSLIRPSTGRRSVYQSSWFWIHVFYVLL